MSKLNKKSVLVLNKHWLAIRYSTVRDAICACMPLFDYDANVLPINIERDSNGNVIEHSPVSWEEWIKLPVNGYEYLSTKNGKIRIPTIIIAKNYDKIPLKSTRPTKRAIFMRDQYLCGYTGKQLTNKTASVDHIIPLSRGGKHTWENVITSDRNVNSQKGSRTPQEAGLRLRYKPTVPPNYSLAFHDDSCIIHEDHKKFVFLD